MRILVAPDSFKGTATAPDAAQALADGWLSVRPDDEVVPRPMADGGEGTVAAILAATPGAELRDVRDCTGPDGCSVAGSYALLPNGSAVVELATASGLPLARVPLAPLTATTRGTGEVIAAALDHGARGLVVALGGSASTDGGAGLLAALGMRFTDSEGRALPDGGAALARLATADRTGLRPPPPGGVLLLTDVTNPLLGPDGAAAVYGPQKGAGPQDTHLLETGLARLAQVLGGDPTGPGAGAAGGTGYGLIAAWGAQVAPGAATIADLLALDAELARSDLLITGEGRFDRTSLAGKVVGELAGRAHQARTAFAVVAGQVVTADPRASALISLTDLAGSEESARTDPCRRLREAGAALARSSNNTV